jgi:hypothetical protein
MKNYNGPAGPRDGFCVEVTHEFDGEGVRNALLAALRCVYESTPHVTLPQFLVALAVLVAERDGEPHTLASLVRQLRMPYSTASRVVWSLTEEGGDLGVIRYRQHPTDRRKKLLVTNLRNVDHSVPRTMMRAMVEYYGDSVKQLSRAE